jgi:hypothetical protein
VSGSYVTGGDIVEVECFVSTDVTVTFVAVQLDLACQLPPKALASGQVISLGITVEFPHEPEPHLLYETGGIAPINQGLCVVGIVPQLNVGEVILPAGATEYLATIHYEVSECATGAFNVILENYTDPPHINNQTRFRVSPGGFNDLLPFVFTPETITVVTGSCCQIQTCLTDEINEFCCSQTFPGARFVEGGSCTDLLPCPCFIDADCDDHDACNGAEGCDFSTGQCLPGTPPNCDDN